MTPGTLSGRVYRHLADRLIAGRFAPGDKLSLRTVSDALGLSIMPVREAVSRLAAEGALDVHPKRAVTVPLMPAATFRDITRVRIAIEGTAAAMAAECRTADDINAIATTEQTVRTLGLASDPDLTATVAANQAFHFALYRAAHSPELLAIIERLWLRVGPIINFDINSGPERLRFGGAVRCHADALAAIRAGDAVAARAAIAADIRAASDFILSQQSLPERMDRR